MGIFSRFMTNPIVYQINIGNDVRVLDMSIANLYETQPNLRAVVSFLADNIAELPLQFFDRVSDNDRQRVTDSTASKLFDRPNPDMTKYELIQSWATDVLLYGRAMWLVLDDANTESGWTIRPIPASWIGNYKGSNPFAPDAIEINKPDGSKVEIPSRMFVLFKNYNPTAPAFGLSPVASLKQSLYEQIEAQRYRKQVWKRGGRMSAYITRPKDVKAWSPEQATKFKEDFKSVFSGDYGSNSGGVPVLEDGMELKSFQLNAKEAQWAESKVFSREEVAAVYHVNAAMIWKSNGQTYASAKDNARALYSDTLAPYIRMFEDRVNQFLLPMIGSPEIEYCEFNLKNKLKGSFEEQASVMQSSVGAPWLTRNEARAMNNLPAIDGGDDLIVPLNVLEGSGYQENAAQVETKSDPVRIKAHPEREDIEEFSKIISKFLNRQRDSLLPKISNGDDWWNPDRWNKELFDDLRPAVEKSIGRGAVAAMRSLDVPPSAFKAAWVEKFIDAFTDSRAKRINRDTKRAIDSAQDPADAFSNIEERSEKSGSSMAAGVLGFAALEAVRQSQMQGYSVSGAMKTWIVTSGNPRAEHAAMDGETVAFDEKFSNGFRFPQDPEVTSPEQSCNCQCEIEVTIP